MECVDFIPFQPTVEWKTRLQTPKKWRRCTVGWNCIKLTHSFHRHKSLSHELGSEWVSERANDCAERITRAKRAVRSKWMNSWIFECDGPWKLAAVLSLGKERTENMALKSKKQTNENMLIMAHHSRRHRYRSTSKHFLYGDIIQRHHFRLFWVIFCHRLL